MYEEASNRLIVALDFPEQEQAIELAHTLEGRAGYFKVGKELFVSAGPEIVQRLKKTAGVFLDLKFHDIPNTVARAVTASTRLGADMITVHAACGRKALEAAVHASRDAGRQMGVKPPVLLGVTVLTSLDEKTAAEAGIETPLALTVKKRAGLCVQSGLGGIVCSAHEVSDLRHELGPKTLLVTPGIRLAGTDTHDQARVMTPGEAMRQGADYIVVGRTITASDDPVGAADKIISEIQKSIEPPQ
ncbi:MAG: orotidine-5'-phosphate decarboxylase [Deltaproteobacteria bacterium]|nr:orotidine-5'-phosphate decarboxylase [Deltaproteobacteria bacterium]